MHPILFQIGSLPIRSYGVSMAVAFLVGILVARRRARAAGLHPDLIIDLSFFVIIASVAGARAAYVLARWDWFGAHPSHVLRIWDGGLALYGGVVLGVVVGLLFFRKRGVDVWRGADVVAPSLALGVAIGRVGCFFNGCCHGRPCELPWAVTFPPGSYADHVFRGATVHPTQIYAALAALVFFFVLLLLDRKKPFDGFLLWLFVILLAVYRFAIDPIRHYESTSFLVRTGALSLTKNQAAGLAMIVVAVAFMLHLSRRSRRDG
ncbi:MAG: prolipoprotein diacylglyceryl transferase [Candidatus Eisenbacteria bacterium]